MKTVIFAGGLGSRISEESHLRPKPMIEIGGKPILWHILKIYQTQGFNDFIICLGYKGYVIKEYFINYFYHNADLSIDLGKGQVRVHPSEHHEDMRVTLVDTGLHTMTAGRLRQVQRYLEPNQPFMLTYGDGLANIDLQALLRFHQNHGGLATVSTVQPAGKFGVLQANAQGQVQQFIEKPQASGTWINGGFFVLQPEIFQAIGPEQMQDTEMWEQAPMRQLLNQQQLYAYQHQGFWKCMDILRDKVELEKLWDSGQAPWKIW